MEIRMTAEEGAGALANEDRDSLLVLVKGNID